MSRKNALNYEQYVQLWCDLAKKHYEKGYDIVLGCTDAPTDEAICRQILNQLQNRGIAAGIRVEHDLQALCQQIAEAEIIISGRMHALIIAKSYDCHCQAVAVSPKLAAFEADFLQTNALDLEKLKQDINHQLDALLASHL